MSCEEDNGLVWKKASKLLTSDSGADIWDDSALIKAYDKAVAQLRGANVDPSSDNDKQQFDDVKRKKKTKKKKSYVNGKEKHHWQVGSKCLALYSIDGLYYEATILSTNNDSAYVKYDFYENEDDVDYKDILPIEMKEKLLNGDENIKDKSVSESSKKNKKKNSGKRWSISDMCYAPNDRNIYEQAVINSFVDSATCNITFFNGQKKKKVPVDLLKSIHSSSSVPFMSGSPTNVAPWANMSFSPPPYHPAFSPATLPQQPLAPFMTGQPDWHNLLFGRLHPSTTPPFIPPPPSIPNNIINGDEEALANMLMSWYMSGYHTGFYQGKKDKGEGGTSFNMPGLNRAERRVRQERDDPTTFESNTSTG